MPTRRRSRVEPVVRRQHARHAKAAGRDRSIGRIKLELVLSPDELAKGNEADTESPEAYQEYLQGRIEWKKRSRQDFAAAIQAFRESHQLDPNLALAYPASRISMLFIHFGRWNPQRSLPKARMNAEKAIELDPTLAETWANLAICRTVANNWSKADEMLTRAKI